MDRDKDSPFSNGLYLANLAVSSNIVQDSWTAISKLNQQMQQINTPFPLRLLLRDPATFWSDGDNRVGFKEFCFANYKIIAFVTSPINVGEGERALVPLENSDFPLLCFERNPTPRVNKAAISLFNSGRDKLHRLRKKVVPSTRSEDSVPYIITGHRWGGSIASLFTLWFANTLEPTNSIPLCITFGSPFLGDNTLQAAVSQYSIWNSCFLHVVHKDDSFPRLSNPPPTTNQIPYKPFGTFFVFSDLGGACFEAPESIMDLLPSKISIAKEMYSNDVIRCLEQRLIHANRIRLDGQEIDSYKAGVTAQVTAVGLKQIQQQTTDALIEDTVKHERGVIRQRKEPFDPDKELYEMELCLAYLERYMKVCRANGQGLGYYDSFKNAQYRWNGENAQDRRNGEVDKYRTILTDYWERVVKEAEKKRHLSSTPLGKFQLIEGTRYRRIVEPLDIAEYYKRGRKYYKEQGRSKHYKLLEEWSDGYRKKNPKQSGPSNSEVESIESRVTQDSSFWAHVEDTIRSCRLLDSGESSYESERNNLNDFEDYVMRSIKNCTVSPDIFLEKTSYMQCWREYEKIWMKRMIGDSHNSQSELARLMRDDPRKKYIELCLRANKKGATWSIFSVFSSPPFFIVLPFFLGLGYFLGRDLRKNLF